MAGAVELPDGRVLSPGAATSQARHHFTTLRQVDQLIEASEADADLGFMARLLALCSLPRTNPKTRLQYVRRNGPYTLTMTASSAGVKLPFGTLPRLLLAWVCSEAVRTQRRDLVLGRSLYEFMHKLGLDDQGGGKRGNRVRLKNQMERLFSCSVSLVYADAGHKVQVPVVHSRPRRILVGRVAVRRARVVEQHDRTRAEVFSGDHRAPDPDRHETPCAR